MKFVVPQEQLNAALSKIAFALENKDTLDAYTHIAIRGNGDQIRLTASNRHLDAEARLGVEGEVPRLQLGVSGSLMKKIAGALPNGPVRFNLELPNLKMRGVTSTFTLPILTPESFMEVFPAHTDYNADAVNFTDIDMEALLKVFKKVWHCVNESHQRREYAAVHINDEHIVATDGFRMAIHPNNLFSFGPPILLHAAQVPRLWKVYGGLGSSGGISLEGTSRIHFICGGIACATKLKTGQFPNYKSIVPKGEGTVLKVPRLQTLEALRRVTLVCSKKNYEVSLETEKSSLTFQADSEIGKAEESVPCEHSSYNLVKLNGRYLADALSQVEEDVANIHLHYNDKGALNMIVVKEGDYQNVILPFRS